MTELADILRLRRRERATSASSIDAECTGALGARSNVEVRVSRAGKGVKLRTWIECMCRTARCSGYKIVRHFTPFHILSVTYLPR